ncbi:hypothetical protein OROHE_012749 [Orobanche hederae]
MREFLDNGSADGIESSSKKRPRPRNKSDIPLNLQSNGRDQGTSTPKLQRNYVATASNGSKEDLNDGEHAIHDTFDDDAIEFVIDDEYLTCDTFEDHFRNNVRVYNSIFSFTPTGGIVDHNINQGRGPYCYRITRQNIHLLSSLLPNERAPKFCQLYIYDTENEVDNRIGALYGESNLDPNIIDGLMKMIDENNELAKSFQMAQDRFHECGLEELKLIFIPSRSVSRRPNHIGPSNEVRALLVGAFDDHTCAVEHDIVVQSKEGSLHRVYETNKFFMALQYPLIFPHGESGFHLEIPYNTMDAHRKKKRAYVTMREWYSYDLMFRPLQGYTRRLGGCLYQKYMVDAYCAIEQYRLNWIQEHQETLRTNLYKSVRDAISRG